MYSVSNSKLVYGGTHPAMKRHIAIIMAADLVNYSLMMGEDEVATVGMIQELRHTHLEPAVEHCNGRVLKRMGDGWILAFNSVAEAVRCAIDVQTALKDHPKITLRMGIHMGDILEDQVDFYGAGVNIAARLQNEAPPRWPAGFVRHPPAAFG